MCQKILVVEDEIELARATQAILRYNKYDATILCNGKEAVDNTRTNNYDLIIMDVMMPVMDGITALKQMRSTGINTPVILLTAKSQIDDKVEGLDAGANDYMTKPFDKKELLARIRAILRNKQNDEEVFSIGNVRFDKKSGEIANDTVSLKLKDEEMKIFELLAKNQERAIPAKELICKVIHDDNEEIYDKEKDEVAMGLYTSFIQDKLTALNANFKINRDEGYKIELF